MRRRLPPLNAVRAFEAAARHLNFQKAGDELGVTAGAVAQQIKLLEGWLGRPLFRRRPSKGVALTDAGQRYAPAIGELLDGLQETTARLLRDSSNILTVSTVPSLAAHWLIPRLGAFRKRRPDLEVRVLASVALSDFAREDVDIAIRLGRGVYPGLHVDLLMDETIFPVCSPTLLTDAARPLREPADLRHHSLLHEEPDPAIPDHITWRRWLTAAGVADIVDAEHGLRFSHTFMALQAAASGQGVALATSALIGDHITAGRLVRPFPLEVSTPYRYYVVCPEATAERPTIAAFRGWLAEEAAACTLPPR